MKPFKRRRVLFILDTPKRDMRGLALIFHQLIRKYKHLPILAPTKSELAGLIKHHPDMIVVNHVQFEREARWIGYANDHGIKVALYPCEGLVLGDGSIAAFVGREELRRRVDLCLTWGNYQAEYCRREGVVPRAQVKAVGCARFDYYSESFDALWPRKAFFEKCNLDMSRPTFFWPCGLGFANCDPAAQIRHLNETPAGIYSLNRFPNRIKDNQRVFDYMKQSIKDFVSQNPDNNFIVLRHPQDGMEVYRVFESFGPNMRVLSNVSIYECLRHIDIYINWFCTTCAESWIRDIDRPTFTVSVPEVTTCLQKEMVDACDTVSDEEMFKIKAINHWEGSKQDPLRRQRREEYIHKYLVAADGKSSERCADAIHEYLLSNPPSPKQSLRSLFLFTKLFWSRIRTGTWQGARRGPDHPKYFNPGEFHHLMRQNANLLKTSLSEKNYVLHL